MTTTKSPSTSTNSPNGSNPHKPNVRAIAGGVVGAVVAVALGILGVMMFRHRLQRRESQRPLVDEGIVPLPMIELPAEEVYAELGDRERTIRP